MTLVDYEGADTYAFGSVYIMSASYYNSSEDQYYIVSIANQQPIGSCTIESDNGQQIKGVFNFLGEILPNPDNISPVNVSNGNFVINY